MEYDNTSFLKFLESKEGSLKELSRLLYPDKEDLNFKTVYELVQVYEDENGKILLHNWKEIFEDLGYMEDFRAMFPLSLSATGPISSSQVIESLHSEDEQRRGAVARDPEAMPREDSLLPQEKGNDVFRPTISSLEETAEPSWPSLPAPIRAPDQRRSTEDKNQKTARRHGQEGTTEIPDLCQAEPASGPQATGITQSDSMFEAGSYPQEQSVATGGATETGNPTEGEDDTGSYCFVPSLQRENELLKCNLEWAEQRNDVLQCNQEFLVESLRCKSQECTQLRTEKDHLERQLEASHAERVNQRQRIDELTRERTLSLAESNEMARQLLEMLARVSEERNRLRERLNAGSRPPPFLDPDDD
ncbi:uncharacterized protein [Montipora capricornis]|uniref:uncharacterized protein n=1 Tax=Montipora capricornis TaxID=246305 RepID=UPI0035F1BBB2